jgi:hypothetical protein
MHTLHRLKIPGILIAALWLALPCPGHAKKLTVKVISSQIICKEQDRYIGWPTVALTRDKNLLAVFSGDRDAHVCPYGKTQMVKSSDLGTTWSAPVTINNTPLDDRDAGIIETQRGTLLVSWFTSLAFMRYDIKPPELQASWQRHVEKISDETKQTWLGNWIRRSTDGGKTWGEYINTIVNAPHGPIPLANGRLLYAGISGKIGDNKSITPPPGQRIAVAESRNDGKTWKIISFIRIPEGVENGEDGFHELHAVEAASGKIVVMIRHHGSPGDKYLWQSDSRDGGKTWTQARPTDIWGLPPHLIRLKNNWLLVTYGRRKAPFGERACISRDEGATWDVANELTIADAPNGDLGYPASVQLDDGSIYTVYYQVEQVGEKTCLMGTRWRIEESE